MQRDQQYIIIICMYLLIRATGGIRLGGRGRGPRPRRATCRAAPWATGGAARAAPPPDVPHHRTAPPSTSTCPRPPLAPPPPPPLHLPPRLALEGGHGLPAQLPRGRRHLALRVIPRRLPTRPLVALHTHIHIHIHIHIHLHIHIHT